MLCNLHQLVLCVLGKAAESWQYFFCMGGLTNAASSSSSCPAKTAKTAKTRMVPAPRFVFYRKRRLLFAKKRVFIPKNEKCPALGSAENLFCI
jgi:hypothetical protein